MIIFLSYASDHRDMAEQVCLALTAAGHTVFFDRDSLPAGDDYHVRIRKGVEASQAFVFLISPRSVTPGSYALTELKYARQKWPDPRRRILPVMIERTEYQRIPNYLKAVTVLEPEGNAPAEIVAALERWRAEPARTTRQRGAKSGTVALSPPVKRDRAAANGSGVASLGRQALAGVVGAFGALMLFLSVVDAGVAGISEGGLLIGAVALGLAYGIWPRQKALV